MNGLASPQLIAKWAAQAVVVVLAMFGAAQAQPSQLVASTADGPRLDPMPLRPVFRVEEPDGKRRFLTPDDAAFEKLKSRLHHPLFFAVITNDWPTGLVPIFAVEKTHGVELRRRSLAGEENTSEPLFFALSPEDEPDASKIAGRWECLAIRAAGSRNFLVWELAVDLETISGRFDQNTEYRVAYVAGGTFRTNRLELRVEYLQDKYLLVGEWRDGKLKGDWRRTDNEERGAWEATREEGRPPAGGEIVRLYEWRHASDNACHYAVEGEQIGAGWERSLRPLCRVWRAETDPKRR